MEDASLAKVSGETMMSSVCVEGSVVTSSRGMGRGSETVCMEKRVKKKATVEKRLMGGRRVVSVRKSVRN
jgi:hypothetical protein